MLAVELRTVSVDEVHQACDLQVQLRLHGAPDCKPSEATMVREPLLGGGCLSPRTTWLSLVLIHKVLADFETPNALLTRSGSRRDHQRALAAIIIEIRKWACFCFAQEPMKNFVAGVEAPACLTVLEVSRVIAELSELSHHRKWRNKKSVGHFSVGRPLSLEVHSKIRTLPPETA